MNSLFITKSSVYGPGGRVVLREDTGTGSLWGPHIPTCIALAHFSAAPTPRHPWASGNLASLPESRCHIDSGHRNVIYPQTKLGIRPCQCALQRHLSSDTTPAPIPLPLPWSVTPEETSSGAGTCPATSDSASRCQLACLRQVTDPMQRTK